MGIVSMSDIVKTFLSQCIDANKCSPLQNKWVSVVLTVPQDEANRYFIIKNGVIHHGKWGWEVSIKDIPLDVYKCLRSESAEVIGWRDIIDSFPRLIELTKGKAAVYWGHGEHE